MLRQTNIASGAHGAAGDYAHLADEWFEASAVEEWRRNRFLMPPVWDTRGQQARERATGIFTR